MADRIEFYDKDNIVASCESSMIPTLNSFISIRGKAWEVVGVTYALDHSDDPRQRSMRANVDLREPDERGENHGE